MDEELTDDDQLQVIIETGAGIYRRWTMTQNESEEEKEAENMLGKLFEQHKTTIQLLAFMYPEYMKEVDAPFPSLVSANKLIVRYGRLLWNLARLRSQVNG